MILNEIMVWRCQMGAQYAV